MQAWVEPCAYNSWSASGVSYAITPPYQTFQNMRRYYLQRVLRLGRWLISIHNNWESRYAQPNRRIGVEIKALPEGGHSYSEIELNV